MARFEVIKAHDGLQAGTIRELPASPVTDYMIKNGYWKEVKPGDPTTNKNNKSGKKNGKK